MMTLITHISLNQDQSNQHLSHIYKLEINKIPSIFYAFILNSILFFGPILQGIFVTYIKIKYIELIPGQHVKK